MAGLNPAMVPAAAIVRRRRRVGSTGGLILDAVIRGVLCTRVALAMELTPPLWLGLEPGRKFTLPLGLSFL
jgi:hypothetical protein